MAHKSQEDKQRQAKKAFEKPDFKALGSVTEITKGPSGGAIDGIFGCIGGFTT